MKGLALVDEYTKQIISKKGGYAPHKKRGLQAADKKTRLRVAKKGAQARMENKFWEEENSGVYTSSY